MSGYPLSVAAAAGEGREPDLVDTGEIRLRRDGIHQADRIKFNPVHIGHDQFRCLIVRRWAGALYSQDILAIRQLQNRPQDLGNAFLEGPPSDLRSWAAEI